MRRALAESPRFISSVSVRARTVSVGKCHMKPLMTLRALVVAMTPSPGMARWCWATAPSFHISAAGDHGSTPDAGARAPRELSEAKRPVSESLRGKAWFAGGAEFGTKRQMPPW